MFGPAAEACADDNCRPTHLLQRRLDSVAPSTIIVSSIPFVLTWIVAAVFAQQRLFPILSNDVGEPDNGRDALPWFKKDAFQSATYKLKPPSAQRLASLVFSTSIGLSTVLVELLLCEIANALNPAARALALRVVLGSLLVLSIVVTPALEIHGFVMTVVGASAETTSTRRARPRMRYALEASLMAGWLLVFWYIPQTSILRSSLHVSESGRGLEGNRHAFTEACLERIGIIGISLMASLSGFAAVSSLWQTFGVRHRHISDTEISHKDIGLRATGDSLATKQSRLRALQRKMSDAASPSEQTTFMGRMMGSIRGGPSDVQELKTLQMEIFGLETMRYSLVSHLSHMRSRRAEQDRLRTRTGRLLAACNSVFAVYCAYRIGATSLSSLRRWWQPRHSFATSDPINNVLALVTTHWDSNLDQESWSRQISFLLSGVMLLASGNAVLQTFRLFVRFSPSLLQRAQTGLPLLISQVAGTYVISSALLLRSNLPAEVGGVISDALGAPLEGRFVEGWFESWFLVAVGLTATGILMGRKVGVDEDWDDYEGCSRPLCEDTSKRS